MVGAGFSAYITRLAVRARAESAIMMRRQGVSNGKLTWALVWSESGVMSAARILLSFNLRVMEP